MTSLQVIQAWAAINPQQPEWRLPCSFMLKHIQDHRESWTSPRKLLLAEDSTPPLAHRSFAAIRRLSEHVQLCRGINIPNNQWHSPRAAALLAELRQALLTSAAWFRSRAVVNRALLTPLASNVLASALCWSCTANMAVGNTSG